MFAPAAVTLTMISIGHIQDLVIWSPIIFDMIDWLIVWYVLFNWLVLQVHVRRYWNIIVTFMQSIKIGSTATFSVPTFLYVWYVHFCPHSFQPLSKQGDKMISALTDQNHSCGFSFAAVIRKNLLSYHPVLGQNGRPLPSLKGQLWSSLSRFSIATLWVSKTLANNWPQIVCQRENTVLGSKVVRAPHFE